MKPELAMFSANTAYDWRVKLESDRVRMESDKEDLLVTESPVRN